MGQCVCTHVACRFFDDQLHLLFYFLIANLLPPRGGGAKEVKSCQPQLILIRRYLRHMHRIKARSGSLTSTTKMDGGVSPGGRMHVWAYEGDKHQMGSAL